MQDRDLASATAQGARRYGSGGNASPSIHSPATPSRFRPIVDEFRLTETSLTFGPERNVRKSSEGLGWADMAATFSDVAPYEHSFTPVSSLWLAMPMTSADIVIEENDTLFKNSFQSSAVMIAPPAARPSVSLLAPCTALDVFMKEQVLADVANEMYGQSLSAIEIIFATADRDSAIAHFMHTLLHVLDDSQSGAWRSEYVARCIAAEILVKHTQLIHSKPVHDSRLLLTPKQVNEIRDFFEGHIDGDFSLSSLASSIGLSRSIFFERFSRTTNQTPHQFLQSIRIERAKKLLRSSEMPLAAIAVSCGFSDQSHLTRFFKRCVGTTPKRYRTGLSND